MFQWGGKGGEGGFVFQMGAASFLSGGRGRPMGGSIGFYRGGSKKIIR